MFDNWHIGIAGAGNRGLSALASVGAFSDGWASRFGRWLSAGMRRVMSRGWPILQTAVAASAAWYLAALILGHEQPFVAPIAAVISLEATAGRTGRRAVEWFFGVAFGLAVADLLMFVLGTGTIQIGIVVALAMAAAMFLGAGPLLVGEAGVTAVLVVTLDPSTAGPSPDRFLDALVGCCVALAVHSLLPVDPKTMVERAVRPILADLTAALEEAASALAAGDPDRAEHALRKAREIDARVAGLREALEVGYETARLSPSRRYALKRLAPYAEAADSLDLAVRNTRVLTRATVGLVRRGEPAPGLLSEAVLDLARAVEDLAGYLDQPGREPETPEDSVGREFALKAAGEATVVLNERNDLPTSVLVGQVRSTAVDLLRASGMHLDEAAGELDGAVRDASERRNRSGGFLDSPA
ncbi:MAG: hypothetical protein QOI57_1332 [Rubrobacteraceae bacterium]|nr:hypothetical protein [Rubrobacteraceae bacterium]